MVDLIAPLRFAAGGVSSKTTSPELCHFLIKDGRVTGYDGVLTMSAPIEVGLNMMPRAAKLVEAIKAAPDNAEIALAKTPAGKLSIKAGKFKVFVDCLPDDYSLLVPMPEGDICAGSSELLPAIQAAIPFCADGKGPTWSQGLRFNGPSVFATNSLVLIEKYHGCLIPREFIIPVAAAKELLKIKDPISHLQVGENSVTFHFGDKWLRTALVSGKWPENVEPMFGMPGNREPLPEGFFEACKTLAAVPLDDEATQKLHLRDGIVSNSPSDDAGSSIEMHVASAGIYPLEQLLLLEGVAQSLAWGTYPKPCPFMGEKLRGILLGFQR